MGTLDFGANVVEPAERGMRRDFLLLGLLLITVVCACTQEQPPPAADQARREINRKLGVVSRDHRNHLILTIPNNELKLGTEVAILPVPGKLLLCCAEIVKKLGPNAGVGHNIKIFGYTEDTTYVLLMNKHGAAVDLGFGIIEPPKLTSVQGGIFRADLNRDGSQESFRDCTSNEGVHLTIWSDEPLKSPRLWHAYYFLEYDVVPSCVEKDYTE